MSGKEGRIRPNRIVLGSESLLYEHHAHKREREAKAPRTDWTVLASTRPTLHAASLLARLFVMRVLFKLPQ